MEKLRYLRMLEFHRDRQRRLAIVVFLIHVRSVFDQEFGEFKKTVCGGFVQRTASFFAAAIHLRAPREIQLREIDPVVGRRARSTDDRCHFRNRIQRFNLSSFGRR